MEVCSQTPTVDTQKLKILMVDDEENILSSMKRTLGRQRKDWDMQFANSGKEALQRLDQERFDIIISDLRMPEMSGFQLLAKVKKDHPDIVRIVLSGYSETERVVKTAMVAHHYLHKPCESHVIIDAVNRAIQTRECIKQPRVLECIDRCSNKPELPETYRQVLQCLVDEADPAPAITKLIEDNKPLLTHLIQIAEAYAPSDSEAISPTEAVRIAGPDVVCALILVLPLFKNIHVDVFNYLPVKRLWKDALYTGKLAKRICQDQCDDPQIQEYANVAGLMHWFGLLVLVNNFPSEYQAIAQKARDEGASLTALETEAFGATQFEIGAYWLSLWGFSDMVVEAVLFQETPQEGRAQSFSPLSALHAARALTTQSLANEKWLQELALNQEYFDNLELGQRVEAWSAFND